MGQWIGAGAALVMSGLGTYAVRREQQRTAGASVDKKRATLLARELEQQRTAIDVLADGLDIGIFLCSADGTIEYANRRAAEMFQFHNPEGRTILAVTLSHTLDRMIREAGRSDEVMEDELQLGPSGQLIARVRAWREPDGDRAFLSLYDVTKIRHLERVRQDFVANVSHELRTPLTSIRNMAEVMAEVEPEDEELRAKYLGRTMDEVDRLSNIVQDLLELSTAESKPILREPCDLPDLIREVITKVGKKATQKQLGLTYDGPPSLSINVGPIQISQVITNLVDNAINYTQSGEVKIELDDRDQAVEIRVRDTGIGIPSEHLPRIFERFYRVDKSRSRASGGTGLGLSIVKHIVESHGGSVKVESMLNRGSVFTVTLPKVELSDEFA